MERLERRHNSLLEQMIVVEPATTMLEIFSDTPKTPTMGGEIQALFKLIPAPLVVSRLADGAILYANEDYCTTFGLAVEPISEGAEAYIWRAQNSQQTLDFYHNPVDRQRILQILATQGNLRNYELRMQHTDGTPLWCSVSLQLLDFDGEPALLGIFHNITEYKQTTEALQQRLVEFVNAFDTKNNSEPQQQREDRKRAEEELRTSELKYRTLIERMNEGVVIVDNNNRIQFVNDRYCEILGYTKEELIGRYEQDIAATEADRNLLQTKSEQCQQGLYDKYEIQMRRKSGAVLSILISGTPIFDAEGKPVGSMGILTNITELEAQEALWTSEAKYRELVERIPAVTYIAALDETSATLYISPQIEALLGYSQMEWWANSDLWYQRIHPSDRKSEAAIRHHALAQLAHSHTPGESFVREYRLLTRAGAVVWLRDEAVVITDDAGQPLFLQGVMLDITECKRAEEEIQLLQTMTQAISEAPDFQSALSVALNKVCEATRWDFGEAWVKSADGTVLEFSTAWCSRQGNGDQSFLEVTSENQPHSIPNSLSEFQRYSEDFTFTPNTGLPGRVWSLQQPVWIQDVSLEPDTFFVRSRVAKGYRLKAGFGVPILADDQVLAVLTFFMFESRQEDRRLVELITAVAAQLGAVLQRKQIEVALRESQRRLASLIDALPGIVFSCTSDPDGAMTYLSEGCLKITGYKSEELMGNRAVSFNSITHEEDLPNVLAAIKTGVAQKQPYVVEYRIRTKSGDEKWVWEKGHGVFDSTGKALGIEGFITDITERKRSEEALQQAEAKYRSIFENALEGIFQSTADGYYLSANPALARLYGYSSPAELMARLTDIGHQLYVEPCRRTEFTRLLQENDAVSGFEAQVYRNDGSVIWIAENARAVRDLHTGELLYYEGTVEDITERKLAKEQLHERAFYDILTGLPNRALFMDRLTHAVERAKRHPDYRFAVLFLDLDRFKLVNDSLGHLMGDHLLIAIARRLEACLRTEDTVARLGGDEFTILLESIEDINPAICVAERIHQELSAPFHLDGHEVFAAASIGIVLSREVLQGVCTTDYEKPEDFLRYADTALYRAKALGKARYEVFDTISLENRW